MTKPMVTSPTQRMNTAEQIKKSPVEIQMEQLVSARSNALNTYMAGSDEDTRRMVTYLQERTELEKKYHASLELINNSFKDSRRYSVPPTSVSKAFNAFVELDVSMKPLRERYIETMAQQLQALKRMQDLHAKLTQKHSEDMHKLIQQYLHARLYELPKVHDAYVQRCEELEKQQSPSIKSPTTATAPSHDDLQQSSTDSTTTSVQSSTSTGTSTSSFSSSAKSEDTETPTSPQLITSPMSFGPMSPSSPQPQRRFGRLRKHMHSLGTSHGDPARQTAKAMKAKFDVDDADSEYRNTIRELDRLDMKLKAGYDAAHKSLQAQLIEKCQAIKTALDSSLGAETDKLQEMQKVVQNSSGITGIINPEEDVKVYEADLNGKNFPVPEPVRYINYYTGECKDLLFGLSLMEYAQKKQRSPPLLVIKCIDAIESLGGLQKEGIYRLSGKQSRVEKIRQAFESDEEGLVFGQNDVPDDVFSIAGILKSFFRELATPLFPFKLDERLAFTQIPDKELRLLNLFTRLLKLPPANYDTLKLLVGHLSKLVTHVDKNKMTIENLNLIFTPAIFQDHNCAQRAPGEWKNDCVLEDLILNYETMFANKDIKTSFPITGVIDYGFEHHTEESHREQDVEDLELSSSSPSSCRSPTESSVDEASPTLTNELPGFQSMSPVKGLKISTSVREPLPQETQNAVHSEATIVPPMAQEVASQPQIDPTKDKTINS